MQAIESMTVLELADLVKLWKKFTALARAAL